MLLLIIAACMPFEINLLGRLTGADIILAFLLPVFVLMRGSTLKLPIFVKFYGFSLAWLCSAVLTDFIRNSAFEDASRGLSKIIIFVINFSAIALICNGSVRKLKHLVIYALIGLSIKDYIGLTAADEGRNIFGDAWKFGYGMLFTTSCFLIASILSENRVGKYFAVSLPIAASAVDLLLNARSLFGQSILSASIALFSPRKRRINAKQLILFAILSVLSLNIAIESYKYAATVGWLGEDAKLKYDNQANGTYGIILGGRNEFVASTQAIIDSPLIGHGSWARDGKYVRLMYSTLIENGYVVSPALLESDYIPTHSHILGAWVDHGLLGAVFWLWIGLLTINCLIIFIREPDRNTGFIVFIGCCYLWDLLFSPFGLDGRFLDAIYINIFIASVANKHRGENSLGFGGVPRSGKEVRDVNTRSAF